METSGLSGRFSLPNALVPLSALPADSDRHIFRVRLTGRRHMDAAGLNELEQALTQRVWALELQDRTRPPQDLWSRAGEDNLTGLFLQTMADLCRQEPEDEQLRMAVQFGLAALENGEDVAP